MVKDGKIYLKLILESIDKIDLFLNDLSFDQFCDDQKTQSAVLMQFQVIGEISKKIPNDIKDEIELPWKEISGFRDIISHDYFNVDLEFVWQTLEKDIPELKNKIVNFLTPQT